MDSPPEGDWKVALQYLGHSGFRIVFGHKTILIDPYLSSEGGSYERLVPAAINASDIKLADLVLITHDHFDHCDKNTIELIKKRTNALIVGNAAVERKLHSKITIMRPIQKLNLRGVDIQATSATHPGESPLGYLITIDDLKIYHAGDTDAVPDGLKCDIALLPVGGTFTMDATTATAAAKKLEAKLFIPMHYDTFEMIKVPNPPGHVMNPGEWVTYG